jgi:hypothetical protein
MKRRMAPLTWRQKIMITPPTAAKADVKGMIWSGPTYKNANDMESINMRLVLGVRESS